ncbi:YcdB/YcdC domain-containing protein [Bacillus sp. SS-TM]
MANAFLKKYTKEGYEFYTYVTVKDDRRGWKEVNYMQEVNSYPLPSSPLSLPYHLKKNFHHLS